jgi:hypothetical protein
MSDAPAAASSAPFVQRWVKDWFLLEGVERKVRSLSPERHALVRKYYEAGTRRAILADEMTDETGLVPALVLYRDAAGLLAAAVVAGADPGATPDAALAGGSWDALAALAGAGKLPAPPPSLGEARAVLAAEGPLAFDETPPDRLRDQHTTVKNALRWLRDRVEPRTVREIRVSRSIRLAVAGALALLVLVKTAGAVFAPTNIALHKKVTISARHPVSVAPADNSGLVNGEIERDYGIHTTVGNAWVMIDLGEPYAIKEVVVHNRADGWFDEGLPFFLELSEDGVHFTEAGRRAEHFSASDPWVAKTGGQRARFVRIRSDHYVTLTEVEVHEGK